MSLRLKSITRVLRRPTSEPYVCSSCLLKAFVAQHHTRASIRHESLRPPAARRNRSIGKEIDSSRGRRDRRTYSTNGLQSTSAINAPSTVPQAYRELHQKLLALQDTASGYIDLSRLQLAARSLESSAPTIRVAFLGLGRSGFDAARRLARVLLSDPLSEEEEWEAAILQKDGKGRSLLLRFGNEEDTTQDSSLVRTLNVPSPFLQRHNLEILVTSLHSNGTHDYTTDREALKGSMLVPSLSTPNSSDGRVGFVRYPVHKTVIVAEGVAGAIEYGRLPVELTDRSLINAALSVPLRAPTSVSSGEESATGNAIDVDLATHALNLFRSSKANGAIFSEEWQTSRMSTLTEWMISSERHEAKSGLQPAVYDLVASLLSTASSSVAINEATETAATAAVTVPESKRSALQAAISTWSADSHRDLQTNLDTAFTTSSSWRRTAWWRLFWRIDDVTISASDVLRSSWLTEAEQSLAFISGRVFDSGLATEEQLRALAPRLLDQEQAVHMAEHNKSKSTKMTVAELTQMPSMLSIMQQRSGVNALLNPPWPQTISLSRQYMLRTLVPQLHRKAQALLLSTLTTFGGSAALGAWFYAATKGLALYETGAIVSLGLVWALRRLQQRWTLEREEFADAVREDARRVLGEVEGQLRSIVKEGGRVNVRFEDARSWQEAKEAIEQCQRALELAKGGRSGT